MEAQAASLVPFQSCIFLRSVNDLSCSKKVAPFSTLVGIINEWKSREGIVLLRRSISRRPCTYMSLIGFSTRRQAGHSIKSLLFESLAIQ